MTTKATTMTAILGVMRDRHATTARDAFQQDQTPPQLLASLDLLLLESVLSHGGRLPG